MKTFQLWNTNIHSLERNELLDEIDKVIENREKAYFTTPNPEIMLLSLENPKLRESLTNAKLNPADGAGISWAYHYLNTKTINPFLTTIKTAFQMLFNPSSITKDFPIIGGSDWFKLICENAAKKNQTIYFLGGMEGIAEKVKLKFEKDYPGIKILGTDPGRIPDQNEEIITKINETKPNILFVALGSPKQEIWIYENISKLNINLALGIGASFDFVAGTQIDAPEWMKSRGIKWIWRVLMSPFEKKIGKSGFWNRLNRIYRATYIFTKKITETKIETIINQ